MEGTSFAEECKAWLKKNKGKVSTDFVKGKGDKCRIDLDGYEADLTLDNGQIRFETEDEDEGFQR
jgi:hypothetical protein